MSVQIEIHPVHLTAVTLHAESMARTGGRLALARNAPTLRATVERFRLDLYAAQMGLPTPRRWADAAPMLRTIKASVDADLERERIRRSAARSAIVN